MSVITGIMTYHKVKICHAKIKAKYLKKSRVQALVESEMSLDTNQTAFTRSVFSETGARILIPPFTNEIDTEMG